MTRYGAASLAMGRAWAAESIRGEHAARGLELGGCHHFALARREYVEEVREVVLEKQRHSQGATPTGAQESVDSRVPFHTSVVTPTGARQSGGAAAYEWAPFERSPLLAR
jgi:hypothetical protein